MSDSVGRSIWFLDTRVKICVSYEDGSDGISVLEHEAYHGDSPPFHIHRNEDEGFYVLEGEMRFRLEDREQRLKAGDAVVVPKGIPHTYRVESQQGARFLTITRGQDFELFVRAHGRKAERDGLPPRSGPPTPEQAEELARASLEYGIELVGPPLS